MGVLIFELLTGSAPFSGKKKENTENNIKNLNLVENKHYCGLSEASKEVISEILKHHPDHRLEYEDILEHRWFSMDLSYSSVPSDQ